MKENKTVFVCGECGSVYSKWFGKCRECGSWNSLVEEEQKAQARPGAAKRTFLPQSEAFRLSQIDETGLSQIRYQTNISEFDRALGGGIVKSSVILLSGEPGIGKSTILLQICKEMPERKILYISGEESVGQIKLRAKRLNVVSENLYLMCETEITSILEEIERIQPEILIIDSIQTTYNPQVSSSAGSVSQVKEVAFELINLTKRMDMSTIIVGHVNKDGGIAGPKVLEHMVDVVLCFEGERSQSYRIIRAAKNRYGSTNEIGLFEMSDSGLIQISDPSKTLLAERPVHVSGSCTVCILEGTRPILAEVQALVTKTVFPSPKRMSTGIDYNRMSILLAVLEKRLGIYFSSQDVYLNVVGGLKLDEPSCDLGIILSLISGYRDIPVDNDLIAIGEVGLSGEIRSVSFIDSRVKEAARLGFKRILLPDKSAKKLNLRGEDGVEIVPLKSIYELSKIFKA